MEQNEILQQIDAQIERLTQARTLLSGGTVKKKAGRPKKTQPATSFSFGVNKPRRKMSAAARKRIGDAQKKRWKIQKAAKKSAA